MLWHLSGWEGVLQMAVATDIQKSNASPPAFRKSPVMGLTLALTAGILLSSNFVTGKYALGGFKPITFALVFTVSASLWSLIALMLTGCIRELFLTRRYVRPILGLGLATGVTMILFWTSLTYLKPTFASFLWRFLPLLMMSLGMIFLNERFVAWELPLVVLMLVGGVISAWGQWEIVGVGVVLTAFAICISAAQLFTARSLARDVSARVIVFYRTLLAAPIIALWGFGTGALDFHVGASYWVATMVGGLLGPCTGFMLLILSYRHWPVARTSLVQTAEPLFVLPMALLFLGLGPGKMELIGGSMILIGAFGLGWFHLKASGNGENGSRK